MNSIDGNLLIYAYDRRSPHYAASERWLAAMFSSGVKIGLPLQSILAFLRISTHPKLFGTPLSMPNALQILDSWLSRDQVQILAPGPKHWAIFSELCLAANVTSNLTTDAHLAALSIEHNATLYSADADFARFPSLRWQNPLVP